MLKESGKFKRWLRGWIIASLVAPGVYLGIYLMFGYTLGEGIVVFWPGSIGLMALQNPLSWLEVVLIYAVLIASNVVLYVLIALAFWKIGPGKMQRSGRWRS